VRLPGRVPWDEVQKELDSASLLACPTRPGHLEGQPRTILEAHMHGRPVVASSVCDTDAKVLTLFHQPCNPQSLAEALETALFDEEVRDGLRKAASEGREAYHNRTLSWGTQLFELMLESA
jgi:glycosyltransferase involved in cell wall biosynthesis